MTRVKRIDVSNFGGIPVERSLHFDGESLILYGENGTGKSSFVRAFEWLFHAEVQGFPAKPGGGFDKRIRNKDHEDESTEVRLVLDSDAEVGRRDNNPLSGSEQAKAWITETAALQTILRRKELTSFIDHKPGERYLIVERWIGLEQVHTTFASIKEAKKRADDRVQAAQDARNRREAEMARVLHIPVVPSDFTEALRHIEPKLRALGIPVPADVAGISESRKCALEKRPPPIAPEVAAQRASLIEWRTGIPTRILEAARADREARDALERAQAGLTEGAVELRATIDAAIDYLRRRPKAMDCPVCERPVVAAELATELARRASALDTVQAAAKSASASSKRLQEVLQGARKNWPDQYAGNAAHAGSYASLRAEVLAALDAVAANKELGTWTHGTTLATLDQDLKSLDDTLQAAHGQELHDILGYLEALAKWPDLERARATVQAELVLQERATDLFHAAQNVRHAMFKERLNEVVGPIRDFYKSIHPNEDVESIDVVFPPPTEAGLRDKNADLEFRFAGQAPAHPRVHLSEGHLDTLGLAFFLMNLHREVTEAGRAPPILILDDVISSVDAPHRTRIATEILRRFNNWQLLITTHDRVWLKRLIAIAKAEQHPFSVRMIRRWNRHTGPLVQTHAELRDDLEKRLEDGDTARAICATAGVLLEDLLNEVRQHYGVPVPGKPDDAYTLMDLFSPIAKRLRPTSKDKQLLPGWHDEPANAEQLQELTIALGDPNIRNVLGAHWNPIGEEIPEAEADRFARGALALYAAFHCKTCRAPIRPIDGDPPKAKCKKGCTAYPRKVLTPTLPPPPADSAVPAPSPPRGP